MLSIRYEPEQKRSHHDDADELVDVAPRTPNASESESIRGDSVVSLSRPVDGFHHPRNHVFTDSLVGRFYADSSLDAETRKTNKCLAGRLRTARSGTPPSSIVARGFTLPNNQNHKSPHFRSSGRDARYPRRSKPNSSTGHGKGQSESTSTATLSKRQQIEKEIAEQKVLMKKLRGRMTSLISHERTGKRTKAVAMQGSSVQPDPALSEGMAATSETTAVAAPWHAGEAEAQPPEADGEARRTGATKVGAGTLSSLPVVMDEKTRRDNI